MLARSAEDAAFLLAAIAGHDERDSTSVDRPVEDYPRMLEHIEGPPSIGAAKEFFDPGIDAAVGDTIENALREFERLGAKRREISIPSLELAIPAYYVVAPAECSSNLSRYDGVRYGYRCEHAHDIDGLYEHSRSEGFGREVKRRILVGTYALSSGYYDAYYLKAQKIRHLISQQLRKALSEVDLIVGPTSPFTAFRIGERVEDPVTMYRCDVNTTAVNLAGPARTFHTGGICPWAAGWLATHRRPLLGGEAAAGRPPLPDGHRLARTDPGRLRVETKNERQPALSAGLRGGSIETVW